MFRTCCLLRYLLLVAVVTLFVGVARAEVEKHCWVSYEEFEHNVPHVDIRRCPEDHVEEGFCRLVVTADQVTVFYFSLEGDICLYDRRSYPFSEFLKRFGPTYSTE